MVITSPDNSFRAPFFAPNLDIFVLLDERQSFSLPTNSLPMEAKFAVQVKITRKLQQQEAVQDAVVSFMLNLSMASSVSSDAALLSCQIFFCRACVESLFSFDPCAPSVSAVFSLTCSWFF